MHTTVNGDGRLLLLFSPPAVVPPFALFRRVSLSFLLGFGFSGVSFLSLRTSRGGEVEVLAVQNAAFRAS